jgi:hypothetical protein
MPYLLGSYELHVVFDTDLLSGHLGSLSQGVRTKVPSSDSTGGNAGKSLEQSSLLGVVAATRSIVSFLYQEQDPILVLL